MLCKGQCYNIYDIIDCPASLPFFNKVFIKNFTVLNIFIDIFLSLWMQESIQD